MAAPPQRKLRRVPATLSWIAAIALLGMAGCAAPIAPRDAAVALADNAQMSSRVVDGGDFRLQVFERTGNGATASELHVYIDHDGMPWLNGSEVAADPSPRDPLALRLMTRDPAPAVYLGRPCHHGLQTGGPCNPLLWTHRRYGETVVESMAQALRGLLAERGHPRTLLIGYSGGGALALLIADALPEVAGVITVAGNLDVAGWTARHGYSPLVGSLDPIRRTRRAPPPREVHLVGGRDDNIPPVLAEGYVVRFADARLVRVEGFDHVCCWERDWPALLAGALGR